MELTIARHDYGWLVQNGRPLAILDEEVEALMYPGLVKTVYILHFEATIGHERTEEELLLWNRPERSQPYHAHAGHYIGYTTKSPEARLAEHLSGSGCPLVYHAGRKGKVLIVRLFYAGYTFEHHLKNNFKNTPALCPICNPDCAGRYSHIPGEIIYG